VSRELGVAARGAVGGVQVREAAHVAHVGRRVRELRRVEVVRVVILVLLVLVLVLVRLSEEAGIAVAFDFAVAVAIRACAAPAGGCGELGALAESVGAMVPRKGAEGEGRGGAHRIGVRADCILVFASWCADS
jgi:hypothetical protein